MNRTYWAIALGCNGIVLDSVYHAIEYWKRDHYPAYCFWATIQRISTILGTEPRNHQGWLWLINDSNYRQYFKMTTYLYWSSCTSNMRIRLEHASRSSWYRLRISFWDTDMPSCCLEGNVKDWFYSLPSWLQPRSEWRAQ